MRIFSVPLLLILVNLGAQAATISGNDSSYIGKELMFYVESDPFTGNHKEVGRATVNPDGSFSVPLSISETRYVYSHTGQYLLYLFAEPGNNYQVVLPKFKEKTKADKLNPYFNPISVHLGTKDYNINELNIQIRIFLDTYIPYYNKHLDKVFTDTEFEQLDKDIAQIEKPFSKSKNTFFRNYRNYKYGMLRFLAYQHKSKAISDRYFKEKPVLYHNPAYIELFNMVYEKYFSYFARGDNAQLLGEAISEKKTYKALKSVLSADEVLYPDELLGMVALKSLYTEFYDDNYSRKDLLTILEDFMAKDQVPVQTSIAKSMHEKVTKLLIGFAPPNFELYSADSNLTSLDKYRGKFVYLNFCSCFSYSCLNEFTQLQLLHNKHKKYLEIVTVVIDDNVEVMKNFLARSGYNWTFLHYDNQPEILQEYDVRIFPTYYLIDHEGILIQSPAASPNEQFEGRLFKMLRAKGIL